MKTQDAIKHAGGSLKLAQLLCLTSGAISQWGEYPPDSRQLQLERITPLKAEPGCLDRLLGFKANRRPEKAAA